MGAEWDVTLDQPTQRLASWFSGRAVQDVRGAMAFSALHGIRPMVETVPLDQVDEAYQKMLSGAARFRMVFTTG